MNPDSDPTPQQQQQQPPQHTTPSPAAEAESRRIQVADQWVATLRWALKLAGA